MKHPISILLKMHFKMVCIFLQRFALLHVSRMKFLVLPLLILKPIKPKVQELAYQTWLKVRMDKIVPEFVPQLVEKTKKYALLRLNRTDVQHLISVSQMNVSIYTQEAIFSLNYIFY